MKAIVKATGVELEVHLVDKQARYIGSDGVTYWEEDLDFGIEDKNNPDYWTRLEHTYAGMAMQGMMAHTNIDYDEIVDLCVEFAHALVEQYKREEK